MGMHAHAIRDNVCGAAHWLPHAGCSCCAIAHGMLKCCTAPHHVLMARVIARPYPFLISAGSRPPLLSSNGEGIRSYGSVIGAGPPWAAAL